MFIVKLQMMFINLHNSLKNRSQAFSPFLKPWSKAWWIINVPFIDIIIIISLHRTGKYSTFLSTALIQQL